MRASRSVLIALVLGAPAAQVACSSSSAQSQGSPSTTDDGGGGVGDSGGSGSSSGASGSSSGTSGSGSGSSSGASSDGGGTDSGSVGPFPFPAVTFQGGPLITAPKVVTITFPSDTLASQLATFGTSVASSTYWDAIRAGYCGGGSCIGDGPAGTSVALATAPAASYTDSSSGGASTLQPFLQGLITAGTVPAPDANTIYALYFPTTTTITLDGAASCQAFDGYHGATTVGSQPVYYSVIPECAAPQMTPPITTLQNTTITASHEFIESASDPSLSVYSFALDLTKPASWGWADVQSVEIGDLCVDPFGLGQDETTENGFTVQRIWSMQNASAGKNPCVPIPSGEVYFNAYSTDSVVVMDVGQSKTIEVDALADGSMGAWSLLPQDWTDYSSPSPNPYVSFSLQGVTSGDAAPEMQVQSGDRIQLQVKLTADPTTAQYGEADAVLVSVNQSRTAAHFWPFVVLSTAEAADAGVMMMLHKQHVIAPHPRSFLQRALRGL